MLECPNCMKTFMIETVVEDGGEFQCTYCDCLITIDMKFTTGEDPFAITGREL